MFDCQWRLERCGHSKKPGEVTNGCYSVLIHECQLKNMPIPAFLDEACVLIRLPCPFSVYSGNNFFPGMNSEVEDEL